MKAITVKPGEGKNAYDCDAGRFITEETQVNSTPSIKSLLKSGELVLCKAPKAVKPKS